MLHTVQGGVLSIGLQCNILPVTETSEAHHADIFNSFPLPSKPTPLVSEVDEHLNRLRDSAATSTSSSINHKLNGLQDLYDCGPVDEFLDGSLRLFDLCNIAKDILLQTKGSIQDIQSVVRRRGCREVELVGEVRKYFTSKEVVQKTIYKALKNVKGVETKLIFSSSNDHETKAIISLLREAEAVTSSMFEYLFTLIPRPNERSKCSSWVLVSKLLHHKRIASVMSPKMSKSENVEMPRQLKELELCIQELEDRLECLFRCMIKARVSFLNAFNR
ncbi:hypothetical protein ES332_A01G204900v1 [Gossypium tomentosum]|uniref:DUF241 domain-containing protein n=1 Tax=Gossypium tomentosum TaxID=34277 RepID=A0A5D2RT85_GOSTO|nr:hypothetical protein ES332_A01G204900v1 [Gossypium tomentosum]